MSIKKKLKYSKAEMKKVKNNIFLIVIFLFGATFAQDPAAPGFYKTGIRYGEAKNDSIYIKWARAVDADTFWVYKEHLSLQYITNANMRTVWYNQPFRYERRMAVHHLREPIFNSHIKFNDLEGLAKNRNPGLQEKFTN